MKVIFDVTCLMPEKLSGVGIYAKNLFLNLRQQGVDLTPVIKATRAFKPSFIHTHIEEKAKVFWPLPFSKDTVFFGPDFRLMPGSGFYPRAVMVHDLAVYHAGFNAEAFRQRGQKLIEGLVKQKPNRIVVPSNYVAHEVMSRFFHMASRVVPIYHGADHLSFDSGFQEPPAHMIAEYFLYVGHLEKRKNLENIITAFELVATMDSKIQLLLVGKEGYGAGDILDKIDSSPYRNRIHIKGYVDKDELFRLYVGAKAFLFPSFYEGFGFPLIEAMFAACPVITSRGGTMEEIAGGAASLADPHRPEDLAAHMHELLLKPELRRELIVKGLERAQAFQWKKATASYMALFQQMLNQ